MFDLTRMDWISVQATAALITGMIALITTVITAVVTYRVAAGRAKVDRELAVLKRQFDEELARLGNKTLFVAEEAAATFLQYDGYPSRSFHFIRHRLRGFTDSELRQILVRAGAVQFTGNTGEERWGLWDRNSHLVKRTEKEESDLGKAPPDEYRGEADWGESPVMPADSEKG